MTPRRDKGSGSLVDKGSGKYLLRVTHEGRSHSRQITAGSRTAAKQRLADFAKEVRDGTFKPIDRTATVERILHAWLEQHRKLAPKTRIECERMIRLHLAPHLGHVLVAKLTPQQIDRCYRTLEHGMAAATVRRSHGVLSAALEWAVRQDVIPANPARRVDPPSGEPSKPRVGLATDTVRHLLDLAMQKQPRLGVFAFTAAASGARRGEAADLRWWDIDWEASTLSFDSVATYLGREQGTVSREETKTKKDRRVGIDRSALVVLDAWRRAETAELALRGLDLDEDCFVFARDPERRLPPNPESLSKAWRRLCVEHGHGDVTFKQLRAWLGSTQLNSGVPIALVADSLGNSPRVLEKHYWNVVEVDRRPAAAFGAAMRALEPGSDATMPPA